MYLDREDVYDEDEEDEIEDEGDWDDEDEEELREEERRAYPQGLLISPFDLGPYDHADASPLSPLIADPAQSMLPDFADRLRCAPKLHLILACPDNISTRDDVDSFDYFTHLDEHERTGKYVIGYINSLCHDGQELLFARLLLPFIQRDDIPTPPTPAVPPQFSFQRGDIKRIAYTALDGTPRTRIFTQLFRPKWLEYTDLEGKAVPMEVLDEMREAEGKSKEEWEGRGIEVGDKAWAVLEKWRAMDV